MQAVIHTSYGPPEVLRFAEIPKPTPKDNEILIKVLATSAHVGDTRMRSFRVPATYWVFARLYMGIFKPRFPVLGMDLAGVVESTGKTVTRFKAGDSVFASSYDQGFGAYAEYKCLREDGIVAIKPANLSFEEAATVPNGAITALRLIRKGKIKPGQKILIYGASGSVGTFAVPLAKHFGAKVTGVCSSRNVELVRSLGADHVIDYTTEDFTSSGEHYDIIFDAVHLLRSSQMKKALKPGGIILDAHQQPGRGAESEVDALHFLKGLIEAGQLRPVIDRIYPFDQIVEAHRYVDEGHKRGNVALTVRKSEGCQV